MHLITTSSNGISVCVALSGAHKSKTPVLVYVSQPGKQMASYVYAIGKARTNLHSDLPTLDAAQHAAHVLATRLRRPAYVCVGQLDAGVDVVEVVMHTARACDFALM